MPWTEPRTFEGAALHGDDADRLGEQPHLNRYSLNTYLSDLLDETMPAKLTVAGDIAVGSGANAIERLAVGADDEALQVNAAGDGLDYDPPGDVEASLYPTTARYDLVVGNSAGRPSRLAVPATGTKILTAHGPGAALTWENV